MKIPFLTLLLLISSSAYAVNHQIGVGIGYGGTEGPNDWDDSGFAGKIDYSYQFHPNFSTEIGYAGVDGMTNNIISTTFGQTKQQVNYSTGYLGLKASLSPIPFFNLYALGGANYSNVEKTFTPTGQAERTESHKGFNPYYGLGAEVVAFNTVGFNVEYRKFFLANDFESDAVFVGLNVKF
ncbi:porin family protein [Vibrio anguillarum]|uniref:Porin family protein n=6 Tax=Vibrio TaxID=662 RepID=A0AAW4ABV2_VIBAN|nr:MULTISPECIES: outer membrane beta-barrel protein [Vibrio]ARV28325.1 ompA-like transmembrane domain protein [Vibrio anguillarum]ASF91024.1 hypothetical protein CEA93_02925 [Vibrio anguillarum]ASF99087.1 hypothetical protein CEG15_02565 [Vibrio anguillarum]ASG02828.1 hypothetical protein CEJ46_02880 [Vibrio anguillarum]ATA50301.1 hypothetical protein CLI14_11330 [Vibrio anguillarum]